MAKYLYTIFGTKAPYKWLDAADVEIEANSPAEVVAKALNLAFARVGLIRDNRENPDDVLRVMIWNERKIYMGTWDRGFRHTKGS